ncbi:N-acetylmuramoyl-L-alanine amidase [Paenibacillus alvei]|uniref:N-acetylmuramoyl-L-alanine amidase n=1 Tax=Paenibacillus alvei TaxID=44250 RepID=UPI0018CE61F6|nr:N-acetylmuramoyl-L-alanine amidase [Paenibacillus alvei]MBG9737280.1 N-acetylmuramoyl-L-alanine amidase [Paenibacillus alvei]MBG9746374.1 N-acetylmuramoyl-L-alanine amidase [Paenibacillus alvei]MCY9581733.1 N-acetylmuramoyl-L-alanine amidase [Paenibacillus alvei]MCY9586140.1 N-acetylmuramoyl-L-alanine amidase [Paenibacillus alvei]
MPYEYRIDHIPRNTPCNRRPGNAMSATTLTIHNTGNPSSTAKNERAWLTNPSNSRTASYHIVIDEREAIEVLPLNENAWHAGDGNGDGNRKSIGIEICESGNYAKTLENAADLVAKMLKERGWGVDHLRRHYDWSGKVCPRLMYDGGKWTGWQTFKAEVEKRLKTEQKPTTDTTNTSAKLYVDGKRIDDGIIIDGVTYFPGRAIANAVGATIAWDNVTKTVKLTTKEAK